MVERSGHIKIVDFGLVMKITEAAEHMPAVGSLNYMAPEALRYQKGGRHTDWWAVGVLAFELLTGCTPWSSLDNLELMRQEIMNSVVLPPPSLSIKASSLISSLLRHQIECRLGYNSDKDVQCVSFFESINWEATASQSTAPAFTFVVEKIKNDPKALENYLARSQNVNRQTTFNLGLETVEEHPLLLT